MFVEYFGCTWRSVSCSKRAFTVGFEVFKKLRILSMRIFVEKKYEKIGKKHIVTRIIEVKEKSMEMEDQSRKARGEARGNS